VEIRLPNLPPDKPRQVEVWENERIVCTAWQRGTPLYIQVCAVDVVVHAAQSVQIPPLALQSVNTTLFDQKARHRLDNIVAGAQQVATDAVDWWLRTLRWKTLNGSIGQREVAGADSGWGTYLMDAHTEARFYTPACVINLPADNPVTKRQWNRAGRSLAKAEVAPVWFDFMFDGEHRIKSGDLHGGILCLAIASETVIRALMTRHLRLPTNQHFRSMTDFLNIRQILDKWHHLGYWDAQWQAAIDLPTLKSLFELRNAVAHRGTTRLDAAACRDIAKVVRTFVAKAAPAADKLSG
jgi:hypothetical protein